MSDDPSHEHGLPENVRHWPTDPKSLLGVSSDVSRRDLKRAYTRLIKQYKPEHAPEEFRRLREAYEALNSEVEWREVYHLRLRQQSDDHDELPADAHDDLKVDIPNIDFVQEQTIEHETAGSKPPLQKPGQAPSGAMTQDQFWQQALDGRDLKPIYRELTDWTRKAVPCEIEYARLYWLLTLIAELDSERDPCEWLLAGIQRYPTSSRLFAMLDTEVRRRNGDVPSIFDNKLLDERIPVGRIVDLVDLRWYAARCQDRFDVIGDDFDWLKRRFLDEADQWLRLLSVGLQHVVLTHAAGFVNQFREEMGHATSASSNGWIWDLVDTNMTLHKAWLAAPDFWSRQPSGLPPVFREIVQLVEATWESSIAEAKLPVQAVCQSMTGDPKKRYRDLQEVANRSRPMMKRLKDLLDQQLAAQGIYTISELTPGLDEELQRFVRKRFVEGNSSNFNTIVLEFCLQQAVTPQDVANTLSRMTQSVPDEYFTIAEQLTTDIALNCMVQAHRLLW
ncbi:MAG: dnaJ 1 [Schlesneria sp.]|nr:dnaJ 1 [Schlesneria sp.]